MRRLFIDTETTGLLVADQHRVIELAAVEMNDRTITGNDFHKYINPMRSIDDGALEVHGIQSSFLESKPQFHEIADEFVRYIKNADLYFHNASFDVGFLNNELSLCGIPPVKELCNSITCTLTVARDIHPGKKNSLSALCSRYEVDDSTRTRHGAMLDAQLLAMVYLKMTLGQQGALPLFGSDDLSETASVNDNFSGRARKQIIIHPNESELSAHAAILESIAEEHRVRPLWKPL